MDAIVTPEEEPQTRKHKCISPHVQLEYVALVPALFDAILMAPVCPLRMFHEGVPHRHQRHDVENIKLRRATACHQRRPGSSPGIVAGEIPVAPDTGSERRRGRTSRSPTARPLHGRIGGTLYGQSQSPNVDRVTKKLVMIHGTHRLQLHRMMSMSDREARRQTREAPPPSNAVIKGRVAATKAAAAAAASKSANVHPAAVRRAKHAAWMQQAPLRRRYFILRYNPLQTYHYFHCDVVNDPIEWLAFVTEFPGYNPI